MPTTISARIAFYGMFPSPSLEAQIHGEAEALTMSFDRITSCRVSVELPHRHQRHGSLYRVVLEIGVPRGHVVVARSPDGSAAHADAHVAVRDAFRAAHRQLEEHRRRHGRTIRVRQSNAV
jgi:ribosome-associated translation inhibitor RaiA